MNYNEMATSREPEYVISTRTGSVLGKKTILKSDHFPGCQNKRLQPQIDGAPNYRQVGSLPVYGVAIPTVDGIRRVLDLIRATKHGSLQHVLWHNLREEPVIYINGRPFVLREVEQPFTNLEYTGINRVHVEQMEGRLKEDVLRESARFKNKILVTDELPDGQMVDQWEPIYSDSVQTPLEVYEGLQMEGYSVDYERVPITDEKPPKESDFDLLVQRISQADINTSMTFNCQMGRGRTTTGMVIATLVYLKRMGLSGIRRTSSLGKVLESGESLCHEVPDSDEALRRGEYTVIRSLIRVLEGGVEGKRQVDRVIDQCSSMQNLREAIAGYRNSIQRQADEKKRETALSFFVKYLERYYFLICFAVYIHTDQSALHPRSPRQGSFQDWMKARPELYSILRRLLRRDPMGALSYGHKPKELIKNVLTTENGCPSEMETIVGLRRGEVLGRQTVLKSDHCPGCQNINLWERVEGAPNFRAVEGFPVYGVANPTVDGIHAVLRRVGGGKGGRPVLWHNMREEPVVYINGKPFVLREVERPYKNMLEYTGIDKERVERMEARLKEDVFREAERYSGAIMVNHETEDGHIFDAWEQVTSDCVQTPLEVYRCLESEGFSVVYARVPITDGKAPRRTDFDTLASNIASAVSNTAFVFNCQMGRGRTTTGTVIACLVKLRCEYGRPLKSPTSLRGASEIQSESSSGDEAGNENSHGSSTTNSSQLKDQNSVTGFVMDDIPLIRKITRILENGAKSRSILDAIIDCCAAMQNLRQAILHYRKVFNHQNLEHQRRRAALNRGAEYLERYFMLIAFAAYLGSEAFDGFCQPSSSGVTFKSWLHRQPEIQEMKWSMRLRPAQVFAIPEIEYRIPGDINEVDSVMEAVVKARNGSVLGKRSILKMYFFPGQNTTSNFVDIPGAPRVCKVGSVPVYSLATPTVDGAKAVLAHLNAEPSTSGANCKAIVTDLREELVVYIHCNPFVLRELEQPVHTLKHVGIKGSAVEQLEKRLKEDILAEAARSGGRILLHREVFDPVSNQSNIIGYWEVITAEDVWTPSEVYAALKEKGYNIDYRRIPLTREREALATDVDAIQQRLDRDNDKVKYLFISHTGYGGVAYAMTITSLKLLAENQLMHMAASSSSVNKIICSSLPEGKYVVQRPGNDDDAFKQGDFRDILSLTRVLENGPSSKAEVDIVIDRCKEAGNLWDDVFYYKQQLKFCKPEDEDIRMYVLDMGIKALRRYFFLIAFRSYLYSHIALHGSTYTGETGFAEWMQARPELAHLCNNLKLE